MISEVATNAAMGGVLGLLIGSFLNVVIHRLPRMMEQEWNAEGAQWAEEQKEKGAKSSCLPQQIPSHSAHLAHAAPTAATRLPGTRTFRAQLPVSARTLRKMQKPISLRYPVVELVCAALLPFA